jgi:hypothetical protein
MSLVEKQLSPWRLIEILNSPLAGQGKDAQTRRHNQSGEINKIIAIRSLANSFFHPCGSRLLASISLPDAWNSSNTDAEIGRYEPKEFICTFLGRLRKGGKNSAPTLPISRAHRAAPIACRLRLTLQRFRGRGFQEKCYGNVNYLVVSLCAALGHSSSVAAVYLNEGTVNILRSAICGRSGTGSENF